MARRNYTREILTQIANGRVAVNSLGPERSVTYAPRSKNDPQPWTNGEYRFNGRYVHTVERCGVRMISLKTAQSVFCAKSVGHDRAHAS